MADEENVVKVPCGKCGGLRNHRILQRHEESWGDDGELGATEYQICKCLGCDTFRYRTETWNTIHIDYSTNTPIVNAEVYPPVAESPSHASMDVRGIPERVARMYRETLSAFNAGIPTLCGAGLRAIVEAICKDQAVPGGNLQAKIDNLVTNELLAKPQADLLHEERYLGNAALHELSPPTTQELKDGLTIVEGLLNTIYLLPIRAARLRAKRSRQPAPEC